MSFKKITAFAASVAVGFLAVFQLALAQDQTTGDGGSGLQLLDTRSEENINPGETREITYGLKNITKNNLIAKAFINDFESDNVSGIPQIIVDNSERTPSTIYNFVEGLEDVELKPDETKNIKLKLNIPNDAAPGGYFGAIRYAAIPKDQSTEQNPDPDSRQVSLTASVAHLVFIEVSGDIVKQIAIENLQLHRGNKKSSIFFKAPDKASLAIKNLGNGFARPFGTVNINNIFNKEVFRYDVNSADPKGIVLPKSSRTFTDDISNIKTPGRYTATAGVAYGDGGEVVAYKTSFWYLPAWFLLVLLLVIALIAGSGYYFYRKKYAPTKSSKRKSRK